MTTRHAGWMDRRPRGRYWPDETQELLLRAALIDGAAAGDAWRALEPRLAAGDAWRALEPRLAAGDGDRNLRRLLPLLGANLRRLGVEASIYDRAERIRRELAERNARLFAAGARFLTILSGAGIDTLMLKGGPLVVEGYRDPGLRQMSDLDIVVPTRRAAAAVQALEGTSWSAQVTVTPDFIRMQHAVDVLERETGLKLDLHWHVYWECCAPDADEELWASSMPLVFEGVATRTLAPADRLLHLCVHGSRRAQRPSLVWVPDVLLVLRAGGIDWTRLLAQATSRQFVLRARLMLGYLRRVFDAPVPDEVLGHLEALPVSRLERLEYWVGTRPQGLLGELPGYWCNYRRLRDGGQVTSRLGFPRYLQQIWKLQSLGDVGPGALTRARKRVRDAVSRPFRRGTGP